MSDTCIVCLGDLNANAPSIPLPAVTTSETDPDEINDGGGTLQKLAVEVAADGVTSPLELIAHLLPCGHNLHDECLKPWVERANSCPICRQNFNEVELCQHLNGPIVSSYAVTDRTQVAEIDPSMLIEDFDEPEFPPCSRCGQDDNEDVLMLCDGCEQASHTYCVELTEVPVGHWFCEECQINRATAESMAQRPRPTRPRRTGTRTRAQLRQARSRDQAISSDWARVWQAVSDRTGFDLDFPHEGGASLGSFARSTPGNRRRRATAWERRLQVAERQGASNRFREGASALFDRPTISRPRPEPPEPESLEEVLAWNAFEKARDISTDALPKTRKRKSTTASPSDTDGRSKKRKRSATSSPSEPLPASQPERRLKRPQTRRALNLVDISNDVAESSSSRVRTLTNGHQSPDAVNGNVPSFLQSLLKEVETSAIPDESGTAGPSNAPTSDHPSPRPSSPDGSPAASNHPSPRAMSSTPPPISPRSGSPAPLTSKVEPIYPLAPDLTSRPEALPLSNPQPRHHHRNSKSQTRVGRWALQSAQSSSLLRPRSEECSPTRLNMSLSAKENVQRLVKEALKLPYQRAQVTKDQYTEINRNVSRMLYDQVGEDGNVEDEMDSWRKLAFDEVDKAISTL